MESAKEQAIVSEDLIGPRARSVWGGAPGGGSREKTGTTHCSAFTPLPVQPAVTTSLPVTVHFVPSHCHQVVLNVWVMTPLEVAYHTFHDHIGSLFPLSPMVACHHLLPLPDFLFHSFTYSYSFMTYEIVSSVLGTGTANKQTKHPWFLS